MKTKIVVFFMSTILLLNIISVSAIEGRIGNARMILYPEVDGIFATEIEKTILVKNVNDIPLVIRLEADEKGIEFIEIIDEEFTLDPDTEKKAAFLVKIKKEGYYEGKVNVFFDPIEEEKSGVVLSSTIIAIAKKDQNYVEPEDEECEKDEDCASDEVCEDNVCEEDESANGVSVMTGGSVRTGNSEDNRLLLLTISTIVLIVVLGYLLHLVNKKGRKINGKKRRARK